MSIIQWREIPRLNFHFLTVAMMACLPLTACSELGKTHEEAEIDRIYDEASSMIQPGMNGDQMFTGMLRMISFVSTECARHRIDAEASGADVQTLSNARLWEKRCKKEVGGRLKRRGNAQAESLDPPGAVPDSDQMADRAPPAAQSDSSPSSHSAQESWADPCVGYFKGSTSDGQFALEVTNRPLEAKITFSDYSYVNGAPAIADDLGRLKIINAETKEKWTVTCMGNQVSVQPPLSDERPLVARRSTQRLQMSGDGE